MVLQKRLRMQGLVILDHYADRLDDFQHDMASWVAEGRIKVTEDLIDGLERAPHAFIGLLEGRHVGKVVVQVSDARASPPPAGWGAPQDW